MIGNGGGSGDPFQKLEDHIRKNPLGADRKRTDLKELYTQNQNPRLNDLTPVDISRSESYLKKDDSSFLRYDKMLLDMKAHTYSSVMGIPLQDSYSKFQKQKQHCDGVSPRPSGQTSELPPIIEKKKKPTSHHSSHCSQSLDLLTDTYTQRKTLSAPPSFGHRPGSGSRMVFATNGSGICYNATSNNTCGLKGSTSRKKKRGKENQSYDIDSLDLTKMNLKSFVKRERGKQRSNGSHRPVIGMMSSHLLNYLLTSSDESQQQEPPFKEDLEGIEDNDTNIPVSSLSLPSTSSTFTMKQPDWDKSTSWPVDSSSDRNKRNHFTPPKSSLKCKIELRLEMKRQLKKEREKQKKKVNTKTVKAAKKLWMSREKEQKEEEKRQSKKEPIRRHHQQHKQHDQHPPKFSNLTVPQWKIKLEELELEQKRQDIEKEQDVPLLSSTSPNSSLNHVQNILQNQTRRRIFLEKKIRQHDKLVEKDSLNKIKDRLTLPTPWDRIMDERR